MSDLPEINLNEKKEEEKKGFFPWLRARLGLGGRGAMGGAGQAGAADIGRATFGAARFGSSSSGFLGGLLSGQAGTVLTATIVAAALGTGIYMSNKENPSESARVFSSSGASSNYVPAIIRRQQNQGSSLEMLKAVNEASLAQEETADSRSGSGGAEGNAAGEGAAENAAGEDVGAVPQDPGSDASAMMAGAAGRPVLGSKLNDFLGSVGGGQSAGGGSFGQKGFTNPLDRDGGGMKSAVQSRKLKGLAGLPRPVITKSGGVKKGVKTSQAWGQAQGLRNMQNSSALGGGEQAKYTQDKAWEGATAADAASGMGGSGLNSGSGGGGAGMLTSPSASNGMGGGGAGSGGSGLADPSAQIETPAIPTVPAEAAKSPWADTLNNALTALAIANTLILIGGGLIAAGDALLAAGGLGAPLRIAGMALCATGIASALFALSMGVTLALQYGQGMLGVTTMATAAVTILAGVANFLPGGAFVAAGLKVTAPMLSAAGGIGTALLAIQQMLPAGVKLPI